MMNTDAEERVRAALVLAFTVDNDVDPWSPSSSGPRSRGRGVLISSLTACAVMIVAIGVALAASGRGSDRLRVAASGAATLEATSISRPLPERSAALEGTMWLLTEVAGTHGTVDLAADHPSTVSTGNSGAWWHPSRNGTLSSGDTVNTLLGTYKLIADRLEIASRFRTEVGWVPSATGHDWQNIVGEAIHAVSGARNPVMFAVTPNRLILRCDGYILTFRSDGQVPDDPPLVSAFGSSFPAPDASTSATRPPTKP